MTPRDLVLDILRNRYGEKWNIRFTENLFIATRKDSRSNDAPTIIENDIDKFVWLLENPPRRAAKPGHSLLRSLGWIEGVPGVWIHE
ncbi:hypothetical protein [Nocardiopsis chromatogenes]|uniref:hypothetical protein n=1 Tax=Nocardiopsis chromatogenes TaxID=280239 RepID=UPI00178CC3FF|nr:hypothetical protein [Nocardiopsis chromatogenes]